MRAALIVKPFIPPKSCRSVSLGRCRLMRSTSRPKQACCGWRWP
jgi:hypothetical protein